MRRLFQPVPPDRRVRRTAQLLIGLVLYGVTAAMMVLAGLGLDPWDVLHQGLSRTFGLGIGTWAILASFVVLLGWIPLRQRLGVGTIANAILVGGVLGNGIATGFYIGAGLGPGARDGLTTGIAARGHSIRVVRTTIEAAVLVTGFLLGGTVGIGTVLYAVLIGPITHRTIPLLATPSTLPAAPPPRVSPSSPRRDRPAPSGAASSSAAATRPARPAPAAERAR